MYVSSRGVQPTPITRVGTSPTVTNVPPIANRAVHFDGMEKTFAAIYVISSEKKQIKDVYFPASDMLTA